MGDLESVLSGNTPLRRAEAGHYLTPFGGIIYKDRVILCRIVRTPEGDKWVLDPLGLRKNNSTAHFGGGEEYHEVNVTSKEFKKLISGAGSDISDFFATVSLPHEHFPHWDYWDDPRNKDLHPAIVDAVGSVYSEGCALLDIGAGPGKLALAIKEKYPSIDVYALDYNEDIVTDAGKLLGAEKVRCGKAQHVEAAFDGKKFDVIVANAFFEREVLEQDSIAREILQASFNQLNPGGYLITTGYTPLIISRADLENAGFEVLNTVVPEHLFSFALPKQLYVARKQNSPS